MIALLYPKYMYLLGSLFLCALFLIAFCMRKDLRRRMIIMGVAVGIVGVLSEAAFFQDYWIPPILFHIGIFGGIEDFLFGFAAGGIGAVIYDLFLHRRLRYKKNPHYWIIPIVLVSELLSLFIFFKGLHINSIYASAIGFVIPALVIVSIRRDLIMETITSAILAGFWLVFVELMILLIVPSYLKQYYLLYNKVPLLLGIVPVTELVWGICFGAVIGPFADFDSGSRPVKFAIAAKNKKKTRKR